MGNPSNPILHKVKKVIVGNIERFFYWYGYTIALNPWKFILACFSISAVCSLGLLKFHQEKNPMNLWIPPDSDFKHDTDWIVEKFQEGYRMQYLLVTAPDVLEPYVIQEVEKVRKRVVSVTYKNTSWEDVCFRIPAVKTNLLSLSSFFGRKKRSFFFFSKTDENSVAGLPFDPSLFLSGSRYCSMVDKLPKVCLEVNIGQIWSNDEDTINDLTKEDIISKLNSTKISPVYGHPTEYEALLGDVKRDEDGKVISAGSLLAVWLTHVNFSAVNMDETGNDAGTSDWVTGPTLAWEEGYLKKLKEETEKYKGTNITMYYESARSFGDISSESMFQDYGKLFLGSLLMFTFVQLVLPSRFNWVEIRLWLGCIGLFCIVLSFVVAVALCSLIGVPYGPVHTSLPFLLLGIGVDDMFVIVSCWKNLSPAERKLKLEEQIAATLRHAGVSITVTSVTDLIAFLIGSFTILPCLQSFCIYTAVGIFIMYIFQATMFVAFLSIDERRIQESRSAILFCVTHRNFKVKEYSKETTQSKVFDVIYRYTFLTVPGKILTLLTTVTIAAVAIKGNLELTQKFDPQWLLPSSSYVLQYLNQRSKFYPDLGKDGGIYIGDVQYHEKMEYIHRLAMQITNETSYVKNVDSWTHGFIKYTQKASGVDVLTDNVTQDEFSQYLSQFLWSPNGARFQKNFKFRGNFTCGKPSPPVIVSSIDFVFRNFKGPDEHLPAMNKLKELVRNSNITDSESKSEHVTVWAKIFANWVTDEVIDKELLRNLAMALLCVMICTGVLIVDLQICFWIFICVLLTLVDVAGFMFFWGIYIDITSCIALVLAVGLCVDFAAHVGHTFLIFSGSRQERALNTVKYIGTANFNGAFSTFLAIALLGTSEAYTFQTFFKIFLLVVVFGLFHGIVFLPVILSMIGPMPYDFSEKPKKFIENEMISCKLAIEGSEEVQSLNKSDVNGTINS